MSGARWAVAGWMLVGAVVLGCGGSGGGSGSRDPFPQGFLPLILALADGPGDVSFTSDGDLVAVIGDADVTVVSHEDGGESILASDVGGAATVLVSVAGGDRGDVFVGDEDGNLFVIDSMGAISLVADTGPDPVTGLAVAPDFFGDMGGWLVAAVGAGGIVVVDPAGEPPTPAVLTATAFDDLAFSDTTLLALDVTSAEIHSVTSGGVTDLFEDGLDMPVGITVDTVSDEVVVADAAGTGTLRSISLAGGGIADLAPYPFSTTLPSGMAFDGTGTLAFMTLGSTVVRGAAVPPLQPGNFGFTVQGPTAGYGDLEFDRFGRPTFVANEIGVGNLVARSSRDGALDLITRDIGDVDEDLLSLAVDPVSENLYVGTGMGNVWRVTPGRSVSLVVGGIAGEVLGLEWVPRQPTPAGFAAFEDQLVATTSEGQVLTIDPEAPVAVPLAAILTSGTDPARLSDLVFRSDGTLFVLDNGSSADPEEAGIFTVSDTGVVTPLAGLDPADLGRPDGLDIDEGGDRLLVVSGDDAAPDQVLAVSLADPSDVTALANIEIDAGYFPTGIVYDRLGRVLVHTGDTVTRLEVFVVFP